MKRIVVIGGGFAGLWSAVGAARTLDEFGCRANQVSVALVNRDPYHVIRVRCYESDLSEVRVPLDQVLGPVGVERIEGDVTGIDLVKQELAVEAAGDVTGLPYDRLVVAAGSELFRPKIPGLEDHAFDVDTYRGAEKLARHLAGLPRRSDEDGCYTVIIIGAGLVGIEAACEMPKRLEEVARQAGGGEAASKVQVVLADHADHVGSDMGASAAPVIDEALSSLGIATRVGVSVRSIDAGGVTFETGEHIPALTTIWAAGMRASPLTALFPVERDRFGRLPVDDHLQVEGVAHVYAAGDVARAKVDDEHVTVMSCQHARPMGRFAGHNVVCDLLGRGTRLPFKVDYYVTILDLGPWGAVYTAGWDRVVQSKGAGAKRTKYEINHSRIYPPRSGDRREMLDAAAPVIQRPPAVYP